jgi:hypothetical protein
MERSEECVEFEYLVSKERLESYRISEKDTDATLTHRYIANVELCSAFYVSLHVFEIGLRNTLNHAISKKYGNFWIQNEIGKLVTVGRMIASLNLGFWEPLLHKKYDSPTFKNKHANFWPVCLFDAFPHIPRKIRTRKHIEA